MFRDGVVWGLATMSRSKDVTIARLCALALCNLSCDFWKEIANSNNCMQVKARASALGFALGKTQQKNRRCSLQTITTYANRKVKRYAENNHDYASTVHCGGENKSVDVTRFAFNVFSREVCTSMAHAPRTPLVETPRQCDRLGWRSLIGRYHPRYLRQCSFSP